MSVALVVGGGTGIGAAVARRLSRDGFSVCVAGRRAEPLDAVARDIDCTSFTVTVTVTEVRQWPPER